MELAMEAVSRTRRQVSTSRKDLYMKQLVKRERSFEQILATRKVEVKVEEQKRDMTDAELLELVGGSQELFQDSSEEAMKIRSLLAHRGVKAKERLRQQAVKERRKKPPKRDTFWHKCVLPPTIPRFHSMH